MWLANRAMPPTQHRDKRARHENAGDAGEPSSSARGTIARIRLHNFMSYRDAEIVDRFTIGN